MVAVGLIFILAILVNTESVVAWNYWTPITIHEVQFDGSNYYAPVAEHDLYNNSPLLVSEYLIWENETKYLPIIKDDNGKDYVSVSEDTSGRIYIELQNTPEKNKNNKAIAGLPILAYSDAHLGEDILNLPVLGSTKTGGVDGLEEPPLDFYIMIPLKNYPEGKKSYVAFLIENPNPPNGKNGNHDWIIPLIRIPTSSQKNTNDIGGGSVNEDALLSIDNDWDIQMDLGLILDYEPLGPSPSKGG